MCGEAYQGDPTPDEGTGPSPRVRGSQLPEPPNLLAPGSIPACAGKPMKASVCGLTTRVHPRVCGEAQSFVALGVPFRGPSPRVRGSLRKFHRGEILAGSIPACAGKPLSDY